MNSTEMLIFRWVGLVLIGLCVCFYIWLYISSRRSGRPLPPFFSAQLIFAVGMVAIGAAGIVGGTAEIILTWSGGMVIAFGAGRVWDPAKQHLRDVGLMKGKG